MKHTKGPWILMPGSTNSKAVYATVKARPLDPNNNETMLSLVCEARIQHADAVLISAAPELLAALEAYQAAASRGIDCDPSFWRDAETKAQQAIAKARNALVATKNESED